MKILDLFAGIGVASLAAEEVWPGIEHEFVEINPYSQTILKKHFPNSPIHDDIKTFHPTGTVDIVWGSPPCQAASAAGKRKGTADDRWLWPEYFRVISEAKPRWTIAENVYGLLSLNSGLDFEELCLGMEALGYSVQAYIIPALACGAWHRRDRVWIVAHSLNSEHRGRGGQIREAESVQGERGEALDTGLFGGTDKNATDTTSEGLQKLQLNTSFYAKDAEKTDTRLDNRFKRQNSDAAHSHHQRLERCEETGNTESSGQTTQQRSGKLPDWNRPWPEVAAELCGVHARPATGLHRLANGKTLTSAGLRVERLKALGNSLCYPVVVELFKAIKYADQT